MCHNSVLESEQIDKCIENGMPTKIIKTLKYTMRRRVAEAVVHGNKDDLKQTDGDTQGKNNAIVKVKSFQMKCPFAHGLLKPPISPPDSPFVSLARNGDPQIPNLYGVRQANGLNNINTSSTASFDDATGITDLSGYDEKVMPAKDNDIYNDDILAKSTQFTRKLTFHLQRAIRRLQKSKIYTLLTKTAQPAHVLAICILSFVLLTIWPELIDGTSVSAHQQHEHVLHTKTDHHVDSVPRKNYTLALIAYLGAFSTHFGAQIWMTFVSGLSLYFSLPRHMFGQCQQILFPKYFAMNGTLSIIMLILFVKYFVNSWTKPQCIQLGALSLTGAIEVIVRLYLAPPLLYLMHEKYKIEGTIGSGKEVGSLVQGDLIQCPHYQRIHKAFRRIHMTVAIGNLITMAASCLHLYYIAGQIHISI